MTTKHTRRRRRSTNSNNEKSKKKEDVVRKHSTTLPHRSFERDSVPALKLLSPSSSHSLAHSLTHSLLLNQHCLPASLSSPNFLSFFLFFFFFFKLFRRPLSARPQRRVGLPTLRRELEKSAVFGMADSLVEEARSERCGMVVFSRSVFSSP